MAEFYQYGGTNGGSYASHFTGRLTVWEKSYSVSGNYSIVGRKLELISGSSGRFSDYGGSYSVNVDGQVASGSGTYASQTYNTAQTIYEDEITVYHNADGKKTISCSASMDFASGTYSPGDFHMEGSLELTHIPRYANFTEHYVSGRTSSSLTVKWNADAGCDWVQYSLNGGAWTDTGGLSYTITGLSPNTQYNIRTRIRRTDSGLWTESGYIYGTTFQATVAAIWEDSKGINWVKVGASCNVVASNIQYRIRKSGDTSFRDWQNSNTFTGLEPNTDYVIQVYAIGSESGEGSQATARVTTYDIPRLTTYPNFNLGDSVTVSFSNPSGVAADVGLYDEYGSEGFAHYRAVSGTSYTFNFTDDELDKMFKTMKGNTLKATFYICVLGNTYRDYKPITITLTGNQKTGHIKVNNSWKRTKRWINVNGKWKRCVRWVNVNGTWKRCI